MKYIVGIGNYARGDDGIGLHLVEALSAREPAPDYVALELKNDALGLLSYLEPTTQRILVVDCVKMGDKPGNWRVFSPEEVTSVKQVALATTHNGDLLQILELARATGYTIPPLQILGIEPACMEPSMELSTTLQERFEEYLETALQTIRDEDHFHDHGRATATAEHRK